jgi:hypothetical protein
MHRLLAIAFLALSSPAFAADAPAPEPQVWTTSQSQVRVSVSRGASENTFNVGATVTDRQTGGVLAEPKMIIKAGAWAQAEVAAMGAPGVASVALSITVDPSGKNAAYFAEIRRADGKLDSESGTLRIAQ